MMRRFLSLFLVLPLLLLAACDSQKSITAPETGQSAATASSAAQNAQSQAAVNLDDSYDVSDRHLVLLKGNSKKFEKQVAKLDGEVASLYKDAGFAIVRGLSDEAAAELKASKSVAEMQRDATFQLETAAQTKPAAATSAAPQSATNPSAAFFYLRQRWHMEAIGADEAWAAGRLGDEDVTVAILDTGIDYENPDLAGLVDLKRSASFVPTDDAYVDAYFPNKHPLTDLDYHGTHVAATVASNGLVGAGVTSQTTLIGAKVCSVLGGCSFGAISEGILHAASNGADVINMSLGGAFSKAGNGRFLSLINNLFNEARKAGALVVVSAGNDSADLQHDGNTFNTYCDAPGVVCVSATGPTASESVDGPWENVDAPAYYTNFGRSAITVAAPGGNDGGSVYAACSQTSLTQPVCQTGSYILGLGGTSMAAPHVSGAAALLMAEGKKTKPSQVSARLRKSADDLGTNGTDPYYGKGRINVANALGL